MAAADGGGSSDGGTPARRHISGLWLGSAVPGPEFAHEVATNPIQWSLTLLERAPDSSANTPTLFGAGFFDDAGDVPGSPLLYYTLRGQWDPLINAVRFTKHYESSKVPAELTVEYVGQLQPRGPDGQPVLTGTWTNMFEGTSGTFACRLEEQRTGASLSAEHAHGGGGAGSASG